MNKKMCRYFLNHGRDPSSPIISFHNVSVFSWAMITQLKSFSNFLQKGVACSRHWPGWGVGGQRGGHGHGLPPPGGTDSPSNLTACLSLFPPNRNPVWISVSLHGTECMDITQIATHHDFRAHTPHPGGAPSRALPGNSC